MNCLYYAVTVISHVFVCCVYRPFLCLRSRLLDSDQSCICVLGLSAFSLSTIPSIGLWNYSDSVVFFVFYFITTTSSRSKFMLCFYNLSSDGLVSVDITRLVALFIIENKLDTIHNRTSRVLTGFSVTRDTVASG